MNDMEKIASDVRLMTNELFSENENDIKTIYVGSEDHKIFLLALICVALIVLNVLIIVY